MRSLWQSRDLPNVQPFEKQQMQVKTARARNRTIHKTTGSTQISRVNLSIEKIKLIKFTEITNPFSLKEIFGIKSNGDKSQKTNNTTRLQRITKLDELELTGSASRNMLINNVKQMFERGCNSKG